MKLSRTKEDLHAETFGDTATAEQMAEARKLAAAMRVDNHSVDEDEAFRDFEDTWGPVLQEDEVSRLDRVIKQLPRLEKTHLSEDEQYGRLTVIALKLGMHDAAEFLKKCTDSSDIDLAEIQEALNSL